MSTAEINLDLIDTGGITNTADFASCFSAFTPKPRMRILRWAVEHVRNDAGRPYDHSAYPHLGAPGGPLDAIDDPHVRTLSLQFATRLGKSFCGQVAILHRATQDQCPMLFASESESALKRIMQRTYKMIYAAPAVRRELLHRSERDHKVDHIQFRGCDVRGAWARSAGTLADMNIKLGIANELDKDGWGGKSTSNEAEPIALFDERFKDYQSVRKVIYESTPTIRGLSRIERLRIRGTNCQYYVPCPKCRQYQVLRLSDKADRNAPGRVEWETPSTGKDSDVARETARYICLNGCELLDEHRPWMLRRGVWCPEGAEVDSDKALEASNRWREDLDREYGDGDHDILWSGWKAADWLKGKPSRDGQDASYQLSSLNAMAIGWGDIAVEFQESEGRPRRLQNFINSWMGETWERRKRKQTWQQLGERMIRPYPLAIVPSECAFLTMGIDKQEIEPPYPYVVTAWGAGWWGHDIQYGYVSTTDELQEILQTAWQYEDGATCKIQRALIDSGFRPKDVGDWVREARRRHRLNVFACKGSNVKMDVLYQGSRQGATSQMPGQLLIRVDTFHSQDWLEAALNGDGVPQMTVYRDSLYSHQDYLEQCLNDEMDEDKKRWERRSESIANDYRDCKRYAYVAARLLCRGKDVVSRIRAGEVADTPRTPKKPSTNTERGARGRVPLPMPTLPLNGRLP